MQTTPKDRVNTGRAIPLSQVFADDFMINKDNEVDFSGAIVHPLESGEGMYMAPLDPDDPRALATRIHEYAHLNLITSKEQPIGIHAAYEEAGIANDFLQAIADAKVMTHCQRKGIDLSKLVVLSDTSEYAIERVKHAHKIKQANLLLRSIGTDLFEFADKHVTLTEKQKAKVYDIFEQIKGMRTLEDWIRIGLEYQRAFETAKLRGERRKKEEKFIPKEPEEAEASDPGAYPAPPKKAKLSEKKEKEKFKEIAKKLKEKYEEAEKEETEEIKETASSGTSPEERSDREEKGEAKRTGGRATSAEKEATKLDVYDEKEEVERTAREEMIKDVIEHFDDLDKDVVRTPALKPEFVEKAMEADASWHEKAIHWGYMEELRPPLEKNFEPQERSKRAKRSYVGAFRYPHRLVSDSAVFASKLRGKGGTLLIDCSGSMGIGYSHIMEVLEKRPFATIALYAGAPGAFNGYLIVVVDRGKCVTEEVLKKYMRKYFCTGNVVDGPALQWLCKRSGEKFWICDGVVTGIGDQTTLKLRLEAAILQRRYNVKRWKKLHLFLAGKAPNYER